MEPVLSYIATHHDTFLEQLKTLLRFQSVSADSVYKDQVLSCAEHVKTCLQSVGLQDVEIIQTAGFPVVFGQTKIDPSKKTILLYGHYDVQPPDPFDLWETPPFEPTIRDGQLYARGVSDDKGQFFCHLKAIEAWHKTQGELPVNIKVIIEGEEEIGSPSFLPFLEAHKEKLSADIALVSDTPMLGHNMPSICFSLRGLLYLELTVKSAGTDLHSGQHGGAVPNAIHGASQLLCAFKNEKNRITIPGFYEGVPDLPADLRRDMAELPHSDEAYAKDLGITHLMGEEGFSTYERRWLRPTLDCNGIYGGYIGEGSKTVIPSQATLKLSMRLVANQNPYDIFEKFKAYLPQITPKGYTVEVHSHSFAFPAQTDPHHPAVEAGLTALEKAYGVKARLQGEGGTIPVVADFKQVLGLETVLMGFNLPDDRIHAPNEKFSLHNFFKGIVASAHFLEEFANHV
jgi:acetylornithine deacetylase/succinyl-diaminopimelate desuccinylase-like protein